MKKKSISLLLVFVMMFSLFGSGSTQVNAADEAKYIYDAAVLSNGTVAVLYISDGTVCYGIYDPQTSRWSKEEVAAGKDCALSVDAADVPYIAYITADNNLGYTYDTGSGWSTPEIIDSVAFGGIDGALTAPDIAVDSSGYVHLTYFDAKGGYEGSNNYSPYDGPDLMYADNVSGSLTTSVRYYGQGWYTYNSGSGYNGAYWHPLAPAKILNTGSGYTIGAKQDYFYRDTDPKYSYHTYTLKLFTSTGVSDYSFNSSDVLYDVDTDGTNVYSLVNKSSTLYVLNGITEIGTATKAATVSGADLYLNRSGNIYYAGVNSSSLLLYQNGTFKESLTLHSAIGSHTRITTVCDSDSQYVLYTDTTGALQIASVSLLPGDTDVSSYEVPDLIPVTISGVSVSDRTYDGSAAAYTGAPSAVETASGDSVSISQYTYTWYDVTNAATLTSAPSDAGSYKLIVSVAESDGTYMGSTEIPFTINKKSLTISGITAGNRSYNGSTAVTIANGTLNGVVGTDQVIPVVPVSGTVATAAAGDDKPVTIAEITLSGTDAANYTLTQPTGITVDISAATLTISGVTATDRDYNATTTVDISGGALSGVIGDDEVSPVVPATGSVATAAAGKDKAVTIATITLSGHEAGNYTLTQPTGITVNIDPATLTISGVAATNRDYNATTTVDITGGTLSGVVEKDDVSPVVPATGSIATAAAGNNKAVTVATITLTGDDAGNYALTQPTGITVDIDTATLTISGVAAGNRNYNGSTSVTISNGTLNGVIGLDQVFPVVPMTGTVATANAGEDKPVTVATIALTGTDAPNYSLTQPTGITVDISPAPLSIASQTVADKTYDGTATATVSAVTFNGLQNGETLTGSVDYSATANFSNSTAGTGKSVSGTVKLLTTVKANNYSLANNAFSNTATISKAGGLSATEPDNIQMTKNLSKSYQYDLDSIALNKTDGGTVTYSLSLLTGDDIFDSDPAVDGSHLNFTSANVATGTATQTVNIHTQNYQDTTVDLTFVLVDRKTVTISGVSVADKTYDGAAISYSDTPAATETEGGATANIGQYTYTWYQGATPLPAAPKDAGSYSLKIAVAADNEDYMGETKVDFTISKKELTVKPMNKTIFTDAPFPTLEVAYAGLVTGEAAADVITFDEDLTMEIQNGAGAPLADTSVNGIYPIVFTNQPAYDSDNYTVVWADGTLTIESEVTVVIATEGDTTTVVPTADVNKSFAGAIMNDADTEAILAELNAKGATKLVYTLDIAEDINGMEVSMSKAIADEMADRSGTLVISTPIGEIFLEETALAAIKGTAGDTLTFSIRENNDGTVTVKIMVDDTVLTDLGSIKVTLPQELAPGQVLVIVAEDNSETIIKKAYPADDGVIAFLPGSATVKVIDHATAFNDISSDYWAKDAIAFVRSRELFFGTGNDKFSPGMTMTRAMFTTVLYRLEGCPDIGTGSAFSDVPEGTWYTAGVNWAAQNSIVMGSGNGKFEPGRNITREEMAVIIYRYCNAMGYDTSARGNINDFVDGAKVSTWARTEMSYAIGAGLINGKNKNNLDPQAYATRAEVAMILQRMIGVILA